MFSAAIEYRIYPVKLRTISNQGDHNDIYTSKTALCDGRSSTAYF